MLASCYSTRKITLLNVACVHDCTSADHLTLCMAIASCDLHTLTSTLTQLPSFPIPPQQNPILLHLPSKSARPKVISCCSALCLVLSSEFGTVRDSVAQAPTIATALHPSGSLHLQSLLHWIVQRGQEVGDTLLGLLQQVLQIQQNRLVGSANRRKGADSWCVVTIFVASHSQGWSRHSASRDNALCWIL